jgi:XTP/dITP diphosphohydrolase
MELVLASNNAHKIDEIRQILPAHIKVLSLKDVGFTQDIAETGKTFDANAEIKANAIFEQVQLPVFADDSGLEVTALNKAPGVKSARYAGEPVDAEKNIDLLLKNLEGKTNRKARFVTVICLKLPQKSFFFEGEVWGQITTERRGQGGFGYDAVFMPDGYQQTFAEMSADAKNQISHRKQALEKLLPYLAFLA